MLSDRYFKIVNVLIFTTVMLVLSSFVFIKLDEFAEPLFFRLKKLNDQYVSSKGNRVDQIVDIGKEIIGADKKEMSESDLYEDQKFDLSYGDKASKVKVVYYGAFSCPFCGKYHREIFPKLKEKYIDTGKIYYIARRGVGHYLDALANAIVYRKEELATKLTDLLFHEQSSWLLPGKDMEYFKKYFTGVAKLEGFTEEEIEECFSEKNIQEYIKIFNGGMFKYRELIPYMPRVVVNGKAFNPMEGDGSMLLEEIEKALK